jgi:hypothetical protein
MSPNKKPGARSVFNRLSDNVKSGLIFSTVLVLICVLALWVQ